MQNSGGTGSFTLTIAVAMPGADPDLLLDLGHVDSWFSDGEKFFTYVGNTVRVYSKTATQLDIVALPTIQNFAGQGNWLWTARSAPGTLQIYAVGASSVLAASYPLGVIGQAVPSTGTIALLDTSSPQFSIVDLAGNTPSKLDFGGPLAYNTAFGSASATDWAFGNRLEVMLSDFSCASIPKRYSRGVTRAIAGSIMYYAAPYST